MAEIGKAIVLGTMWLEDSPHGPAWSADWQVMTLLPCAVDLAADSADEDVPLTVGTQSGDQAGCCAICYEPLVEVRSSMALTAAEQARHRVVVTAGVDILWIQIVKGTAAAAFGLSCWCCFAFVVLGPAGSNVCHAC